MDKYSFQYCQKIVVFSKDEKQILLARRKGETDYDGVYSFIGGKMEIGDKNIIDGLKREKNEEVGVNFIINIHPFYNTPVYFTKKDGSAMILPHYYAKYIKGDIVLSDEYSDYKWVDVSDLQTFEPKIETIPQVVNILLRLKPIFKESDFIRI